MKMEEDISKIENQVDSIAQEHHSLAYELIMECKKKTRNSFIIIVLLILIAFFSNMAWLLYFSQFDFSSEETTIDSGNGTATYLENSKSGDINYGEN